MAKRKAGVKDIIYELDNDDIELSSDDEVTEAKFSRCDDITNKKDRQNTLHNKGKRNEVINLDSSSDNICDTFSLSSEQNGGKTSSEQSQTSQSIEKYREDLINVDESSKSNEACINNTMVYNEDIIVDSPASNSDLGVVGCENKTPLVTVRFKDSKLAYLYKERIRTFLINLLRSHSDNGVSVSEVSDVEVDIWPEDLIDEEFDKVSDVVDNLFFVDTAPCDDTQTDVPKYSQTTHIISNIIAEEASPTVATSRRGPTCFNCDGAHQLKDCLLPRNNSRIAAKRKTMPPRVGRYHVEDEQKYGHLIPGRISGHLRHALGLKRYELPLHIYRMRLLGYPPGWLEEARISHSGITLFDSSGNAIQDPEEEEGELCELGSKDKFDIKKILDFPGFNVPASSQYIEEAHLFGLPSMSEQDSKIGMLQTLAPNAMKAYKRKKLTFFPSAQTSSQEGQAEMELDSGDEVAAFPSIPPLPDDEPAPRPPPPPTPPPDDNSEKSEKSDLPNTKISDNHKNLIEDVTNIHKGTDNKNIHTDNKNETILENKNNDLNDDEVNLAFTSEDELEVIEVVQVTDIPVPEDDLIIIDDDDDKSQLSSVPSSPGLDVLEEKKNRLLAALKGGDISAEVEELDESVNDMKETTTTSQNDTETIGSTEDRVEMSKIDHEKSLIVQVDDESICIDNDDISLTASKTSKISEFSVENGDVKVSDGNESKKSNIAIDNESSTSKEDNVKTPDPKTGHVKVTSYGTPVLNVASPYLKLPTDDKFSKNICDVINYENLPNSTGKFKQIRSLLKKVKTAVDRIQDS